MVIVAVVSQNDASKYYFTAVGEWGKDTTELREVAAAMHRQSPNRSFNILVGNNFCPSGVTSLDDPRFKLFTDELAGPSNISHYVVMGEADHQGDESVMSAFQEVDSRWVMMAPRAKFEYYEMPGDRVICIHFIDTSVVDYSMVTYLASDLQNSCKGHWKIVVGHHPIWSGSAPNADSEDLRSMLLPTLHKGGVHMYISAHQHVHEILYDGKLVQVVTGGGSDMWEALKFVPHDKQIWGISGTDKHGYLDFAVSWEEDQMEVSFVSGKDGSKLQSFNLTKNGTKESMFGHIQWNESFSGTGVTVRPEELVQRLVTNDTTTTKESSVGHILGIIIYTVMAIGFITI